MFTSQLIRFLVVGVSAFLVNWFVVVIIVSLFALSPLIANILGFIIAFSVSYFGHKNWTFLANDQSHATSLSRFIMVALIGFMINEGCYAFLLNISTIDYRISLIFTLILAAISTYFLSRFWAFNAK